MKGFNKPVWIIVALLLAVVILAQMIVLANKGRVTAEDTFSQTDLINCCNNCCITCDPATTTCSAGELTEIANGLGIIVESCGDIPFCECSGC